MKIKGWPMKQEQAIKKQVIHPTRCRTLENCFAEDLAP
jgi:hypothetical protein